MTTYNEAFPHGGDLLRDTYNVLMDISNERSRCARSNRFSLTEFEGNSFLLEDESFSESALLSLCLKAEVTIIKLAQYDSLLVNNIKMRYFATNSCQNEWIWQRLSNPNEKKETLDFVMTKEVAVLYQNYIESRFQWWKAVHEIRQTLADLMDENKDIEQNKSCSLLLDLKERMEEFQECFRKWYSALETRLDKVDWTVSTEGIDEEDIDEKLEEFEKGLLNANHDHPENNTISVVEDEIQYNDVDEEESIDTSDFVASRRCSQDSLASSGYWSTNELPLSYERRGSQDSQLSLTLSNNSSIFEPLLTTANNTTTATTTALLEDEQNKSAPPMSSSIHDVHHQVFSPVSSNSEMLAEYQDWEHSAEFMRIFRDLFNNLKWNNDEE